MTSDITPPNRVIILFLVALTLMLGAAFLLGDLLFATDALSIARWLKATVVNGYSAGMGFIADNFALLTISTGVLWLISVAKRTPTETGLPGRSSDVVLVLVTLLYIFCYEYHFGQVIKHDISLFSLLSVYGGICVLTVPLLLAVTSFDIEGLEPYQIEGTVALGLVLCTGGGFAAGISNHPINPLLFIGVHALAIAVACITASLYVTAARQQFLSQASTCAVG